MSTICYKSVKNDTIAMLLFTVSRSNFRVIRVPFRLPTRHFTVQNVTAAAKMPPRLVLNEDDIVEAYLKGTGPGGQKIVCRLFYRPISINFYD